MSADSYSEPLGVVLQGRYWLGESVEDGHSDVVLRVDDEDDERPDILDLRADAPQGRGPTPTTGRSSRRWTRSSRRSGRSSVSTASCG
jgi:hypothetical protein